MTKIIPSDALEGFIQRAGWTHGQQPPARAPLPSPAMHRHNIDDLIKQGKSFFSDQKDTKRNCIGVAVALEKSLKQVGKEGIVASMPYLVAGKATADKDNYLWKNWFTALSEEDVGIDKEGRLFKKGTAVVVTVHGGGILGYGRIMEAYKQGLTAQNAAKLTDREFDQLLQGILPDGNKIQIYNLDDVRNKRIPNPFGTYAVITDLETAKSKPSGHKYTKSEFIKNPLVLARVGTPEYVGNYFEKAKHTSENYVRNWHRFHEIDPSIPQGRVLFLDGNCGGLFGNYYLSNNGRFVGVAQEMGQSPHFCAEKKSDVSFLAPEAPRRAR